MGFVTDSGLCSVQPFAKSPIPTHPNHQPLRSPRRRHVKHPRGFLLVFALGGHVPHTRQRHHGELQALADLHGQDLIGVGCGLVFAGAFAPIEWQFASLKRTALTQLTQSIVPHQLADDLGLHGVFAGFEWVAGARGG